MRVSCTRILVSAAILCVAAQAQSKPAISLDEFMNASDVNEVRIAPDGSAVVMAVSAPDWQQKRFNEDLWLWSRKDSKLIPLTHSGHDSAPEFSPDGKYIAFLSDRALSPDDDKSEDKDDDKSDTSRVWLIPVNGGEAFPLYREKLDAHTFAWSADGASVIFSTTQPLSKDAEEAKKAEWKDVIRWREQERGDVLIAVPVAGAFVRARSLRLRMMSLSRRMTSLCIRPMPRCWRTARWRLRRLRCRRWASRSRLRRDRFRTGWRIRRITEIFVVPANGGDARQITHNNGLESHLTWSKDGKRIYFAVHAGSGSIEGAYQDVQGRLYVIDPVTGTFTRLGADFAGSWDDFTLTSDGKILACGLTGTEVHLYGVDGAKYEVVGSVPGTYAKVVAARDGQGLIFTHSTINSPTQVYFADGTAGVGAAKAITTFNPLFADRAQVEWATYKWTSKDGTPVEGVLIYPPGKKGAKNLRMLVLIHGGPEDADGNHFGADWYDWATLAAAKGWLVFRPNYRGSTGYGDKFMLEIAPHLVSVPGVDILSGVDALVKDGIADPNKLAIGGYSYGGYMTNWLITQTTRFKAAVTGAGAVEHAANWGNDDLTWDDAWYLGGTPWEKPEIYQSEAALFQINKVTTPTHIVGGNADVRVSYLEQVLLERALQRLNVPHTLLVFPGENHPLDKNPWHGYIKVREELKWLEKYVPQ